MPTTKTRKGNVMKLVLLLFFNFICLGPEIICSAECEPSPLIIYLKGTCSAGKTSLAQSVKQHCDLEIIDEDSIMQRSYVEAVAGRFPCKFECITLAIAPSNLYHALREKDILFKMTASSEECTNAEKALNEIQEELDKEENLDWKLKISHEINEEVIQKLGDAIAKNKNALLDSWYLKEPQIKKLFPDAKMITLLLYCPLNAAYERLNKRNETALLLGNLQEKRYLRQLLGSFIALYQISEHPTGSLEKVSRNELAQIFEMFSRQIEMENPDPIDRPEGPKPIFTFAKLSRSQFLQMKSHLLRPLELSPSALFYVSPKNEYDLIIDNSNQDILEIIKSIKHRTFEEI
jgi:shikimate kinase